MYFSHSDMELLRLAGWCKNLPADISGMFASQESGSPVFDTESIRLLIQAGLLNVTKSTQSIWLREKGSRLLRNMGYRYHRDTKYRFYRRRMETAQILLTFWRAGFQVYASSLDDLADSNLFLPSMAARRDKASDVWGGAVFWGLARIGQSVCACYHVEAGQEQRINYRGERFTLDKAALRFSLREAMFFAGSDYLRLARAFRNTATSKLPEKDAELTLPQIRETANHPLHLLEYGDTGALQLRIMREQYYRERLAAVMIRKPSAPPAGVTAADGMMGNMLPWVLVDLDICRIDRAYRQTMAAGHNKLVIICLEQQREVLQQLYGAGHVEIFTIPKETLVDAFGELSLYKPPDGVYTDEKGGMIDAAHLPVD